jgi:hypothetical protein
MEVARRKVWHIGGYWTGIVIGILSTIELANISSNLWPIFF